MVVRLVLGGRRGLVAPLEDSNPAKLLQRGRELFGAARHDAVQVHRVLRNFNLNMTIGIDIESRSMSNTLIPLSL